MQTDLAPDSARLADAAESKTAAYVHIPFCHRVCPYCDFAVMGGASSGLVSRYFDALIEEIRTATPSSGPLDAVFFGGGTPSAASHDLLGSVLAALEDCLGLAPDAEVSIEANPEDVTDASVQTLAAAGFNRVSLGVQSFDDRVLRALGRSHTASDAAHAVAAALTAMRSVNVDLIFGTPGETLSSWMRSVDTALSHGIHHLSTYALTVEPGTPLAKEVAKGSAAPDPDDQADKYEASAAAAAQHGLVRYETSNASLVGHGCEYNLITWARGDYYGFGNGAHRHHRPVRSWNIRGVERYVAAIEGGRSPVFGSEVAGPWAGEVERVMLGLRRASGVAIGEAGRALLDSQDGQRLVSAGVLMERGERLVVERPLLGDAVSRALLALDAPDC